MPVNDKRQVSLEIAGSKYRISSDADPVHLERLAALVNERVASLGLKAARTASPAQILAVVALGLADDLLAADKRARAVEELTRKAITGAIERIDRRLESEDGSGKGA